MIIQRTGGPKGQASGMCGSLLSFYTRKKSDHFSVNWKLKITTVTTKKAYSEYCWINSRTHRKPCGSKLFALWVVAISVENIPWYVVTACKHVWFVTLCRWNRVCASRRNHVKYADDDAGIWQSNDHYKYKVPPYDAFYGLIWVKYCSSLDR